MEQPTNLDLQKEFQAHAEEDASFQRDTKAFNSEMAAFKAETEGSLAGIHRKLAEIPTHEEEAEIIAEVMGNILKSKGKKAYAGLLFIAGIVGALVVIGGGAKALLGWIGFTYLGK